MSPRPGIAAAVAATAALLLLGGCSIQQNEDVKLSVPYFEQKLDSFDCGPATVQMWAGYDHGASNVPTQQEISTSMGGTTFGTSPQRIADAVNQYTHTYNAYVDLAASDWETKEFMSRQITSIDNGRPTIAIVDGGFHAVIVTGGLWHIREDAYYQWDYTYFHDPLGFPHQRRDSSDWIHDSCPLGSTCQQIADGNAVAYSGSNLSAYGHSVYDSTGCGSGGCTPVYQD
jgi:hypothetical protein